MNKVKCLALSLALVFVVVGLVAQIPEWQWAVQAGSISFEGENFVAIDCQGNQYVTGTFWETTTIGQFQLTSNGERDIFAAKLDTNGNWLWAVRAGGSDYDSSFGIAVDGAGNAWLTGVFNGSATFGSHALTSSGSYDNDIFAAKLDQNGNFIWAVRGGGTSNDYSDGIAVDDSGNAYLTGYFNGSADFGSYTLSSSGNYDIFAAKLNPSGSFLWAVQAGGIDWDGGFDIDVDGAGNAYLTGCFYGSVVFGPYTLTSSGNQDVFVARLDPNGNWIWAVRAVGTFNDFVKGIAVDGAGNTYIIGYFEGSIVFGSQTLSSIGPVGTLDIFAAKLDPTGNWLWAVRAGGIHTDAGYDISLDGEGSTYLTGCFYGSVVFGPYTLTSSGSFDIFAAKLDQTGNWLWAIRAGGTSYDIGYGIAVDGAGKAYLTGYFMGSAAFGPYTLICGGSDDIFIAKLTEPLNDTQITLISPNGGELLLGNTTYEIQWTATGVSLVYIDLKGNEYADWIQLENMPIPAALGSYIWHVPNINTDQAWIRIRDASNPAICDVSGPFTIITLLKLVSPSGGEVYLANSICVMYWGARPPVSLVVLDLSLDDGFSWHELTDEPINAALGQYFWTVPNIPSSLARIRVSDASNPTIYDITDPPFSIIATGPYPPQNISIAISDFDVQVSWDAVTWFNLDGPITPDYYLVFSSADPYGTYVYHGATQGLQYISPLVGLFQPRMFYRVVAYKYYGRGVFDPEAWGLVPGMREEEVYRLLR